MNTTSQITQAIQESLLRTQLHVEAEAEARARKAAADADYAEIMRDALRRQADRQRNVDGFTRILGES